MLIIFLTAVSEYDQVSPATSYNKSDLLNVMTLAKANLISKINDNINRRNFWIVNYKAVRQFFGELIS
jgi:hypothetical protein